MAEPPFDPAAILANALRAIDARIRTDDAPHGLPFDCPAEFLRNLRPNAILNLRTPADALDISFSPAATGGYRDLEPDAVPMTVAPLGSGFALGDSSTVALVCA